MADTLRRFPYMAAVCLVLVASGSAFAQQVRDRELVSLYSFPKFQTPIEIVSIKLKDKEVQPGEKIKGDDEWLQGLSFRLKNVSDKPISYVGFEIRLTLPKRVVGYYLGYGFNPSFGQLKTESSESPIQPGQTMDLVLTKEKYAVFLNILAQAEVPRDFDKASYFLSEICFENEPDIKWAGGNLMRRDPIDPNKFNAAGPYFLPIQH